jgi:hypothetical protein
MREQNLMYSSKLPTATLALFTLLWMGCQADGLRGVGLYESSNFHGLSVSMAGGGLLNIAAKNNAFDGSPVSNTLSFETDDLTG